ncbi:MAG: TIGR01777 family oxidoreductase [Planctomycetaceae bacterium]
MNVMVTGATGLVGTHLLPLLKQDGHEVITLTRRSPRSPSERQWDPAGKLPAATLDGVEAIIHLAGENIGDSRWTAAKKQRIRDSRVIGTRQLAEAAAATGGRIKTFVCASAIGFYGDRGQEELTEDSPAGTGFLPDVCREWEAATWPARDAGIRVVNLRLGVVLSKDGGALAKMLLPFKMCVGGIVGSGRQYWSWLTVDEAARMFRFALQNTNLHGPVNAVSPLPVTNLEFTKALGEVLHRPTIFPLPAFMARLVLGEMADDLILGSTRVIPSRLQSAGYAFSHPEIGEALASAIRS